MAQMRRIGINIDMISVIEYYSDPKNRGYLAQEA